MARKGVEIPVYLNIDDAVTTAESLGKKIEGALEKHKGTEDPQIAKTLKGLEAIQRQLEATEDFRKKLTSGSDQYQDLLKLSDQWATVEQSTRKAYDEYKKYLESIGRSKLVESFTAGPQSIDKRYFGKNRTPEITEQIEKLKELYAAWSKASSEKEKYMGMAYNAAPNDLTQDEANAIATSFQKANDEGDILLLKLNQLEKQNEKLNNSGKQPGFKQNFYIVRTLVNDISRGIRNLDSKLKSFTSRLTGIVKNMLHLGKESRKTTSTLNDGFKHALRNIMRYGLGIRSLFFLFRRLRKYALEALGEMAKQLPEVNAQMSRAVQAMNQMKGSLGTLVQPLLNVLVPALEKVAALISKIANLIGGVFAILTGQGKIYKATAGAVDYAASLDKTGAAAKKAKKELEGYLSPIDEINKYQSKRDDDEDSGSGGGAGAPAFTFEEMEPSDLAKKVADFIQRLIEPIKKAWENMGNFVRISWRYAMNEVLKLGKSVARDFWRVWEEYDTQRIFQNLFEAIGWIGQAVGNLAKRFREAWDYNDTGYRILAAIRDIILVISEHIRRAAKATAEWADSLDFKPLLTAFADWLESLKTPADAVLGILEDLYTHVILPLGKWAVEVGGPKLLKVFIDFNKEVKWDELRTKLTELWDALRPFAQKIGEGIIMFIDELSDAAAKFINSQKFKDFIDLCIKWMNDVEPEDVARTIKLVAGAIIALKGALFLLEGIKTLNTTVAAIKTFLALFGAGGTAAGAAGEITKTATAIGKLHTALRGLVGTALGVDIYKNIRDVFKLKDLKQDFNEGKLSAHEFLEKLKEFGGLGRSQGSLGLLDNYSTEVKNLNDAYKAGSISAQEYQSALSNVHEKYKMQKTELTPVQKETRQLISDYAQGVITTKEYNEKLAALDTKYKNNASSAAQLSSKTTTSFNQIKVGAANMASSVMKDNDNMNGSYDNFKSKTSYNAKTVANEVYNAGHKMEGVANSLQKTVDTDNTKINDSVSNMSNTVKRESNSAKDEFNKSMDDMSQSVTDNTQTIKNKTDEIKSAFDRSQWTFSGVAEGLGETFRNAIDKVRNYWNPLADSLSGQHTLFGKTFSIDLPKIPYLAQGAVIPPNKEFMAVLGDQKSGTNIETPLSTMVEAFNQALRNNGGSGVQTINFLLPDRRTLAQYTIAGGRIIQTSTGKNPFELA